MKIILGSRSPRRRELLSQLGYDFKVIVSNTKEIENGAPPEILVKNNALEKAKEIAKHNPDYLVICADTVVVAKGAIIGKPKNLAHARAIIELLQDNSHHVLTAVVCQYNELTWDFLEKTTVFVAPMNEEEINAYINTNEPYDKAGAYAIQGLFAKYITRIEGDFYNVMGLPLNHLYRLIEEIKLTLSL